MKTYGVLESLCKILFFYNRKIRLWPALWTNHSLLNSVDNRPALYPSPLKFGASLCMVWGSNLRHHLLSLELSLGGSLYKIIMQAFDGNLPRWLKIIQHFQVYKQWIFKHHHPTTRKIAHLTKMHQFNLLRCYINFFYCIFMFERLSKERLEQTKV